MSIKFTKFYNLYAPENDNTGGEVKSEKSLDDIIAALGDDSDDDKKEVIDLESDVDDSKDKKSKEDKDDKEKDIDKDDDEDDDLEDEIEEDLEDDDPDDEKLELAAPISRKEILKQFPDLFKKIPYLEKAYYREREYTNIYPTIDEARDAASKATTLDRFEKDLINGNLDIALKVIKNESPKNFNKVVDNYLDIIGKVDEKAQHHIISNILKTTIISMVNEGRESNNEALQTAAQIVNQFIFGSSKFQAPTKLSVKEDDKEDEAKIQLDKERSELVREKFETAERELNIRVTGTIKSTIDANIDTKDSMTPYVKKAAIAEAYETLTELINKDTRFKTLMDRLWDKAIQNKLQKEDTDKIKQAYISKARTLLPSVIKKARNEALKGMGKRVREDSSDSGEAGNGNKDKKSEHRSAPKNERSNQSNNKPRPGETALEFLMRD